MMKKICLKIHRRLGLALGVFVAVICFSGAVIVFQDEIKDMMPRDEVAEQQAAERGEFYRQPDPVVIDVAKKLHRYLLDVPEEPHEGMSPGRYIVGTVAICMTLILLTGIVIWWPKSKKMLRNRLTVKTSKGFRRFVYDSHVSLGIYAVAFLLLMSLTGPSWSFHWYRQGAMAVLGGDVRNMEHHGKPDGKSIQMQAPQKDGGQQMKQSNNHFRPDGKKPPQALLMELHTGKWGGIMMKILYFLAALIGGFLPISGYYMWWKRTHPSKKRQNNL